MAKKTKLRGIETYAFVNRQEFLDFIANKQKILVAINTEKIMKNEPKLHNIINRNIGYADGVGAVMALKQKNLNAIKIPGAEFWLDIINTFYKDKSIYIIGSSQKVIENTVKKLQDEFKDINIVGYRNGYLTDKDKEELKNILINKQPDIVFVAQGSPRQEYLMDELIHIHPALYMGLGGSFDVYCGLTQRAPKLFLKLNLEWFYRLLKQPLRFKRQLVIIKFLILYIRKKL